MLTVTNFLKVVALAAAMTGVMSATAARAEVEGPFLVRLRALHLDPANKSDAAGEIAKDAVHINGKWLPDIDGEYFFTPHWSTELVLT